MSKVFRPYEPEQMMLMPVALQEWLREDHLVYFISDVVEHMDLSEIMSRYEGEKRGYPPYHPKMMVKVLLYAYCVGIPSSRKIARRLEEDIAFRVLSANNTPDFRTISDFRKEHLSSLSGIFVQVLRLCQRAGLVKLGHVALDGTKVKANASKHRAMSYGRMKEEEVRLEKEVRELLQRAEQTDEEEDQRCGSDRRGDELPEELAYRQQRLARIREAKEALEEEARREAETARLEGKSHNGTPREKAQRNFTDPESKVMPVSGGKDFVQAYNAQAAVDSKSQIVVSCHITNAPQDKRQALPLIEQLKANLGGLPREVSADAGYYSEETVIAMSELGIEPLITPQKTRHHAPLPAAPKGRIPRSLSVKDRMRRKLRTRRGRERYKLRMETVEPVFGQIKQGRGFRQFLLRGMDKVSYEWQLICTGHNLLKLFGSGNRAVLPRAVA
ncbi:MAG: IS1182 family transposase [Dehalococcoidia bacterium]